MKTEICNTCGGAATVTRRDYITRDLGIPVKFQNIELIECPDCGSVEPVIPNMNGLMLTLATAIVCSPQKLDGEEVRFLRKYVGKSAIEFSCFLHVDSTHLSKIENDRTEIGSRLDKLVRLLAANMNRELMEKSMERLMKMMPDIKDSITDEGVEIEINPETMSCQYALA
jgi:DNA-binding transcriptional regulator YiaG